jgi:hypothetical protein
MHQDFAFKHGKVTVEVKGYYPRASTVLEGELVDPRSIPEMLLAVKVDGQDFGTLPYRQLEDEVDTRQRARELVESRMGRKL